MPIQPPNPRPNSGPDSREGPGAPPVTIMLLEPEVIARMTIAEYLRDCGYKVIEGERAEDAFTVLAGGADGPQVHIILAEARLPGVDGFELSRKVRENYPHIDVILTAGVASTAEKAGKLCDGGPLEKPFYPPEPLRRIRQVQERRRTASAAKSGTSGF